jgi:hypothetical protein
VEIIDFSRNVADVSFDRDEILVLHSALNEICNGIEFFEFETRVGANHDFATNLLQKVGLLIDNMDCQPS